MVSVESLVVHEEHQFELIEQSVFNQADPMKQVQAIIEQLVLPAESAMFDAAVQLCHDNDLVKAGDTQDEFVEFLNVSIT